MSKIVTHIENGLAEVRLNRPDLRNAFDDEVVSLLHEKALELEKDESVRLIVLRGEGKSFCAGADLNWMRRMVDYSHEENVADATAMADMFEAWNRCAKPVLGRIHGAAIGGGTGLVAVCDHAVATTSCVFAFSEVRLGILPAVISPFVLSKVGLSQGRSLFLSGERFSAERAMSIGLVHEVCPDDEIDRTMDTAIQSFLQGGPHAQTRIKALLKQTTGMSPSDAKAYTSKAIAEARASEEGQGGMRSFLERTPKPWLSDDS